jgi:exopolyphosphatase/pppGpp-phosphohydrolase
VRLAAVDVGSNSIHMIIAQVDARAGDVLWRAREMVGLGRSSSRLTGSPDRRWTGRT